MGLSGGLLVLWCLWGASATRRAIRLALPLGARWSLEPTGVTLARVLVIQVAPLVALAALGPAAAGAREGDARAAAAGVLCAVGITALLAAARVTRAERDRGRRLLRQPRRGLPRSRRALFLEPEALTRPRAGRAANPWPAHRPPPREQRAAIELEPANGAATHPRGVRYPRTAARAALEDPEAEARGWDSR
jgi:hypothetical protein